MPSDGTTALDVDLFRLSAPTSSPRFRELLLQLQQEHERAVAAAVAQALGQKFPDIVRPPVLPRLTTGTDSEDVDEEQLEATAATTMIIAEASAPTLPGSVEKPLEDGFTDAPSNPREVDKAAALRKAGYVHHTSLRYSLCSSVVEDGCVDEVKAVTYSEVDVIGGRHSPLRLTIIGSRNLPAMDWGGLSDPFCWCEVVSKPADGCCLNCGAVGTPCSVVKNGSTQKEDGGIYCLRTKDANQTLSPNWHYEGELDYPEGSALRFVVFDKDGSNQEYIGEAMLEAKLFRPDGFKGPIKLDLSKCSKGTEETRELDATIIVRINAPPKGPRKQQKEFHFSLRESWGKNFATGVIASSLLTAGSTLNDTQMRAIGSSMCTERLPVQKTGKSLWHWRRPKTIVISPNSPGRVVWDCSGLILITYDMITIPLQAFDEPPNTFTDLMDWVTLLFWTGDMLSSWFLGYTDNKGELEMRHGHVIKHYLKSWFIIDIIVVGPDWVITVSGSGGGGDAMVGLGRLFRGVRALRVLRLLRLLKLKRIINLLYDCIESEYMLLTVNMLKYLVYLATINHVVACAWYGIGNMTRSADEPNWIDEVNLDFHAESYGYRYLTSFHWSLTQFTPASIPISPHNFPERLYGVIVLFFAMVCFSTLIGSITSSMNSIRSLSGDESKQFWLLRRYFRQKKISFDLSQRIQRFLEHRCMTQHKMVQATSIKLMVMLSEQLQNELDNEVNVPSLLGHPYFQYLKDQNNKMKTWMDRLCHTALRNISLAQGDVVFQAGDTGEVMRFVRSGTLEYRLHDDRNLDGEALPSTPLTYQKWISEPVLWTPAWHHQGDLNAIEPCVLVILSPETFLNIMRSHPRPWSFAKHYAEQYIEFLNQCRVRDLTDVILLRSFFVRMINRSLAGLEDLP